VTNPEPTVPTRTLGTDWGTLTASCSHPHRVALTAGRGATPALTVNHVDYFCGIVVGRNEVPQHRHLMLDGGWHVQHDDAWHALRRPGGGDATDAARKAFTATILPALRRWLDSDDAHVLLAEGDSYWRRQLADWAANTEADLVTAFKRLQAIAQQVARGETASAKDERFARYARVRTP
jgi:hypothetical protein